MDNLNTLKLKLEGMITNAADLDELERVRISSLGKKGEITLLMKDLSNLDPENRKAAGRELNILKQAITNSINIRKGNLENIELESPG